MKSCRECNHQVSKQAVACPDCGAPYPAREHWDGFRKEYLDMKSNFRKRLLQGDHLTGTIVSLPCPQIAELLSRFGFDWLFIDGEHGPLSVGDIQLLLQAAQPQCPCVVRVAANHEVYINQGYTLNAVGMDTLMLGQSARRVLSELKP